MKRARREKKGFFEHFKQQQNTEKKYQQIWARVEGCWKQQQQQMLWNSIHLPFYLGKAKEKNRICIGYKKYIKNSLVSWLTFVYVSMFSLYILCIFVIARNFLSIEKSFIIIWLSSRFCVLKWENVFLLSRGDFKV